MDQKEGFDESVESNDKPVVKVSLHEFNRGKRFVEDILMKCSDEDITNVAKEKAHDNETNDNNSRGDEDQLMAPEADAQAQAQLEPGAGPDYDDDLTGLGLNQNNDGDNDNKSNNADDSSCHDHIVESYHVSCASTKPCDEFYCKNPKHNIGGVVLYMKDGKTDWYCNSTSCKSGYIIVKGSDEVRKQFPNADGAVDGEVYGAIYQSVFDEPPSKHKLIGSVFARVDGKWKFRSGVLNEYDHCQCEKKKRAMNEVEEKWVMKAVKQWYENGRQNLNVKECVGIVAIRDFDENGKNKNENNKNKGKDSKNNENDIKMERKDENKNEDKNGYDNKINGPRIKRYGFGKIEIYNNGELKGYGQGYDGKRADFLFWNDKYEAWNWKNKDTYVDTHLKHPLLHSPGITWKLVEYMINKSGKRKKGLKKLILSQGFGLYGINSTGPGQLPCHDKVLKKIAKHYPGLVVINCKSNQAIKEWNDAIKRNEMVSMCLHMTC